ncbi:MAG: metallophosphoesterase [Pirellulales bacterium]
MAGPSLRFVQAGDFHLELPLHGVAEIPENLRDTFIEAPYQAAETVFDTAVSEDADFLLLCGDVLDPHAAGARGILFLLDHFDRLAEHEIPVYWVGGTADPPDSWPVSAPLPDNVHVFPRGRPTETVVHRGKQPVARICGASRGGKVSIKASEFDTVDDGTFSIGMAHGGADVPAMTQRPIDYWAVGGRHVRGSLASSPVTVHYSGTPQGRHPAEVAAHGCTLVEVDELRKTTTRLVTTDVVRWHHEHVVVDAATDARQLEQMLGDRTQRLVDGAGQRHLLIGWTIAGESPVTQQLRLGKLADDLLARLRRGFTQSTAAVWTVSIEAESTDDFLDAWYEEDTMLGELLRNARSLEQDAAEQVDLARYIGDEWAGTEVEAAVEISDFETRKEISRQAAILGSELLRGDEARS